MEESKKENSSSGKLETREMLLNIGPAHPAMHGIIEMVTKLDGEQIKEAEVKIGYLHRGFEKMVSCQNRKSIFLSQFCAILMV